MLSVGLTGNVGSGKSTVASLWRAAGIPVVSADELSRRATERGSRGLEAVRAAFGDAVLAPDGSLDRARMRSLVFGDAAARERLESILHPIIAELRSEWLEERRAAGDALVVSEVPLLHEKSLERDFDAVVLVDAPAATRLDRLVRIRGLAADEAARIMDAQMDSDEKRRRADHVVANVGTMESLEREAARVLADLRAAVPRSGSGGGGSFRMDLHLHTNGSWDCLSDPEAVLAHALSLGYARIAITDHDRLSVALAMAKRHPERIIAGEEVRTGEGVDVIGLYLTKEIPRGTTARETIASIKAQGGIAYLPHPYASGKGRGGRLADALAPLCDVVEVFNARLHAPALNRRAEELATRHGRLRGAGSDAHTLGELGNAFVEVAAHPNRPDALLGALARGRTGGSAASRAVHLASTWAKIRKKLPLARSE